MRLYRWYQVNITYTRSQWSCHVYASTWSFNLMLLGVKSGLFFFRSACNPYHQSSPPFQPVRNIESTSVVRVLNCIRLLSEVTSGENSISCVNCSVHSSWLLLDTAVCTDLAKFKLALDVPVHTIWSACANFAFDSVYHKLDIFFTFFFFCKVSANYCISNRPSKITKDVSVLVTRYNHLECVV